MKNRSLSMIAAAVIIFLSLTLTNNTIVAQEVTPKALPVPVKKGYAPVNGMRMYYEIYGSGKPLLLIHGAYSAIGTSFQKLIPGLSRGRQVIAVELQGHGRTADIDRALTYEQLADDISLFLKYINIDKTDIFGYSLGAAVAVQVGIRHTALVDKLVLASVTYHTDGIYPDLMKMFSSVTPDAFTGTPWKKEYDEIAPDPKGFTELVRKLKRLDTTPQDWKPEVIRSMKKPTLIITGDADIVRPEHSVQLFRLLGGGVPGDIAGLPVSRLAILPGTTHVTLIDQQELLLVMIPAFLDGKVEKIK